MSNSEQLQALVGNTIIFKGAKFKLISVKPVQKNHILKTDKKTIVLNEFELIDFLKEAQIVTKTAKSPFQLPSDDRHNMPMHRQDPIQLSIYEPTPAQKKVQDALLIMLDKVQEDKEHITQAKAVCDIANTMVNVERSQIELIKLSQNLK